MKSREQITCNKKCRPTLDDLDTKLEAKMPFVITIYIVTVNVHYGRLEIKIIVVL